MWEMAETGIEDGVGIGCEFSLFGDDGFFGIGWLDGGGDGGRRGKRWVDDKRLDDLAGEVSDGSSVGFDAGRRVEER